MFRHITKALLALCVVAAMSLVVTTPASAASHSTDRAGSPCAQQRSNAVKAKKKAHRADDRVRHAKKATKRADSRKERHAANKRLKKAKKQQRAADHRATKAKRSYAKCRKSHSGEDNDDTSAVVQQCQEAGLPAEVCDAIGMLPDPTGGAGDVDLAAQCVEAGLPTELCNAVSQLPETPDPSDNPLCGVGLPLPICDEGLLRTA